MKNQSDVLRRILLISAILIAVGPLGCCIVLNVESLRTPFLAGVFAFIACAGCIGMILYSTVYVMQKLREDMKGK